MVFNPLAKSILFFFAVAFVYGVAYQGSFYFYGETPFADRSLQAYPIFASSNTNSPTRLWEHFLSGTWFDFYQVYIAGVFLKPLGGETHFVDGFLQAALIAYALTYAGFCFVSLCFVRLFVKLNYWQMAIYALLFYLFFVVYMNFANHYIRLMSYQAGYALALGFLYPITAYILTKRDVFSAWQPYHATALMVILCYFSFVSILFTTAFVSIALFCLWLTYLWENRADFSSLATLWHKLKEEPKWLLVSTAFAFVLSLTVLALIYTTDRGAGIINAGRDVHPFAFIGHIYHWLTQRGYYDDKQWAFVALVVVLCLAVVFYRKLGKDSLARVGVLLLGVFLFTSFGAFLFFASGKVGYLFQAIQMLLFVFATLLLGASFWLLREKPLIPVMAFAMMVFSLAAVRELTLHPRVGKNNGDFIRYDMKQAVNLGYTFACYGQARVPVPRAYLVSTRWTLLPWAGGAAWRKRQWKDMEKRYTGAFVHFSFFNHGEYKNDVPPLTYYFEPSVDKINAQLAALRRTAIWRCARKPVDIYRIEKLDY